MAWYDELAGALTWPAHQVAAGVDALGRASAARNRELQGEYMARDLRNRGIPNAIANPMAQQYAEQMNIHRSRQEEAAVRALHTLIRQGLYRHRG